MRKAVRYSSASAVTGLLAASALAAYNDRKSPAPGVDYRRVLAAGALLTTLTWITALS